MNQDIEISFSFDDNVTSEQQVYLHQDESESIDYETIELSNRNEENVESNEEILNDYEDYEETEEIDKDDTKNSIYFDRAKKIIQDLTNHSNATNEPFQSRKRPRISSDFDNDTSDFSIQDISKLRAASIAKENQNASKIVSILETQLSDSHEANKQLQIQNSKYLSTIENLENEVSFYKNRLTEIRMEENQKLESILKEQSQALEKQKIEEQRIKKYYDIEINSLKESKILFENQRKEYENKIQTLFSENNLLRSENIKLEEKLDTRSESLLQRQILVEKDLKIDELTQKLSEHKSKIEILEVKISSLNGQVTLKESLSSQIQEIDDLRKKVKSLTSENENLKRNSENIYLLREKNESLRRELEENQKFDEDIATFLKEYDEMKRKVQDWQTLFNATSPSDVQKFINLLQDDNQQLIMKVEKLQAQFDLIQESKKENEEELNKLTKQLFSQESLLSSYQLKIEDLKQQIYLLEQEKESTNEVLKTYNHDIDEANKKRIEELQKLVDSLNSNINSLTEAKSNVESKLQTEIQKQREDFLVEINRMKNEFQEQQNQKILHFRLNPQVQASQHASNELTRLRSQVKILEEQAKQNDTFSKTSDVLTQEFNKRIQRHNEVFKEKISEFRRAMYLLCGFRLDILDNYQYKLSSMYAEQKDDHLLFQYDPEEKRMSLVESPYSLSLQNEGEAVHYLKMHSIPGFTSQITIDLLSKQTLLPHQSQ